ncbi:hypothetical protein [Arcobacter roscoffensis]|uniref:Tox-MPTase4 domain-containing protein n=1 Tax=Arcobacter roscoffensis TaxID=2961520 RepID=A0ABY5E2Q8_9BACT|nr:hypothetical protein [Arcobacter roscoffensis]UTJ05383.1 hypothetical protein NJU99_08890 [Arcobacter roscoffensis]
MAKIIYTDNLKEGIGGSFTPPLFPPVLNLFGIGNGTIKIRKKYIKDKGILNHELCHEKQFKQNWFHIFRYRFSKKYRLECELEAYKEQIKEYKYKKFDKCKWIIKALHEKYNLDMSKEYLKDRVYEIWKKESVKK